MTKTLVLCRLLPLLPKPSSKKEIADSENLNSYKSGDKMKETIKQIETYLLKDALDNHNNNKTRAAKELGISRNGLIKKLKRLNQ